MSIAEQYAEAVKHVRNTVLHLIEAEKAGQEQETLTCEVDQLFQNIINLPGDSEFLYRCRLMVIEALEDLRLSFESRKLPGPQETLHGSYWQSKRASYLLKIQAAEEEIKSLKE